MLPTIEDEPSKCRTDPDHSITERLRLAGTSGGHVVLHPAQTGPPRANCPGPCPSGETQQPLGASHARNITHPVKKCFLIFTSIFDFMSNEPLL